MQGRFSKAQWSGHEVVGGEVDLIRRSKGLDGVKYVHYSMCPLRNGV